MKTVKNHIDVLDGLRAWAIILVVLFHSLNESNFWYDIEGLLPALVLTIILSHVLYVFIERPFIRWSKKGRIRET